MRTLICAVTIMLYISVAGFRLPIFGALSLPDFLFGAVCGMVVFGLITDGAAERYARRQA